MILIYRDDEEYAPVYRQPSHYHPLNTFQLPTGHERQYQQQYGDMYFLRLARLKPAAEEIAKETWEGLSVWGFSILKKTPPANSLIRLQGNMRAVWNEYWT